MIKLLMSIKDFALNKTRLFIEYLLIGFVVSLAGMLLALWLQKNALSDKLEKVQETVIRQDTRLTAQDQTIIELKTLRAKDAVALDGLINDYKVLAGESQTAREKFKKLEQSNDEVRRYMRDPIPAALKCLLNNTCKPAATVTTPQTPVNPSPSVPKTN